MNLQNTLEYIASVAQNHPLINSSYVGSIYDLNSNTNTKYAVFAVENIDVTKQSNSLIYNCYLYVVDRVMNDESNTTAVQTMAVNTLQEIINYIEGYSQSLAVSGSYIITPIRQKFSDECAGAYVQLRLVSQNDIGECAFSDDKVVEIFQGKTYLLDNYFTKSETLTLLDGKQDTLIAGDNITIVDNVISSTGGGGDSVWEKDANNNIFPKGNTNVTGSGNFVTGLASKADHTNSVVIGYNCESRANSSVVIGNSAKDYDTGGDRLGWLGLIAMGTNPVIPPRSLNTPYATWQQPKFIVGGLYGFSRWNTLEQTVNGDLYIKGINGWTGTNATPDGTSHLQGYLSGLNTRISNNTTAIEGKQNTLTAGENIDITNDVISVPQEVYLGSIFSPEGTYGSVLSFSARTQGSDYTTLSGAGSSADTLIELKGAGNDNEASSIDINAYGYSDANVQLRGGGETRKSQVSINAAGYSDSSIDMRGGTASDNKSTLSITANGETNPAEIQMRGGDANNSASVNIDSEKFTYNDNDVAVEPIDRTFDSGDTVVLNDNYIYSGSSIASLTINGTNFTGDCLIQFTTGSTTPSITISGLVFDVLPTFNINKYYELGIHNGHCLWVEYDS